MEPFYRIVRLGRIPRHEGSGQMMSIFCKIELAEKSGKMELSISGVEGPLSSGNCLGSCGQIDMHLREPGGLDGFEPAPGWTLESVRRFLDIWERWHLNGMSAADSAMRRDGWHELAKRPALGYKFTLTAESMSAKKAAETAALDALRAGETFYPSAAQRMAATLPYSFTYWVADSEQEPETPDNYERAKRISGGGIEAPERKTLGWLKPSDHPLGLLGKVHPESGKGYGSAWYYEPVPADVLEWLAALPETDISPAWV